jgi:hypothetical protein
VRVGGRWERVLVSWCSCREVLLTKAIVEVWCGVAGWMVGLRESGGFSFGRLRCIRGVGCMHGMS